MKKNTIIKKGQFKDPLKEIRKLRNEISFSEKEIQSMIKSSKRWSNLNKR